MQYKSGFRKDASSFTYYQDLTGMPGSDPPKEVISVGSVVEDEPYTKSQASNPGWRKKVVRGELVFSEYDAWRTTVSRHPYTMYLDKRVFVNDGWGGGYWDKHKFTGEGDALHTLPASPSELFNLDAMDQRAVLDLARKTKKQYQKVSGSVFLGEIRQTLRMIASPARALRTAMSSYLTDLKRVGRKVGKRNKSELRRAVNNAYLEATFGWTPLISDIQGAAQALAEVHTRRFDTRVVTSKWFHREEKVLVEDVPGTVVALPYTAAPYYWGRYTGTLEQRAKVRYWTFQDYTLNQWKDSSRTLDAFGISLQEFVPTLWELLPWSFVVDYFTNIGDILEVEYTDWSRVLYAARQSKVTRSYSVRIEPDNAYTKYVWGLDICAIEASEAVRTYESYQRLSVDLQTLKLDFTTSLPKPRQDFNLVGLGAQLADARRALN